jgi:hypothetical protein
MSSLTNVIKARAKLTSMQFPYLVTLLILLPFILFCKHSGLVQHNLCGARRRVKWHIRKCAGRWAFLHRKSHLRRSLIPPARAVPSMDQPSADLMSVIEKHDQSRRLPIDGVGGYFWPAEGSTEGLNGRSAFCSQMPLGIVEFEVQPPILQIGSQDCQEPKWK